MTHETMPVQQTVREYIVERYLSPDDAKRFSDDDDLLAMLDSLQILRLLIDMESQFAIKIPNSELMPENLGSVTKVAAFIERKLTDKDSADIR
jgi:acyl carrier protein